MKSGAQECAPMAAGVASMQRGRRTGRFGRNWSVIAGLAALTLVFTAIRLEAQQPYANPAYGNPYAGQYAAPPPQYPQQPQYAPPRYSQQQYGQQPSYQQQPQYAQPQYPQQPQYAQPEQPYQQAEEPGDESGSAQPLSADQLEQLLAPVALYPDALLAEILAGATYPAQVAVADQWLHDMRAQGYGSPDQIAAGADAQTNWDPSIKALTAFPQVLDMLNQNLEWTTNLGNAYYNQPQDVMQTVQVLRERAEQAGNLESTPQEEVTNDRGYIELAPPDPQVVYVPAYNPWAVYGQPIQAYPGFSFFGALGSVMGAGYGGGFGGGALRFGLGIAMAAFEHAPWGWMGWGLSWLTHSVLFNHSDYSTHSTTVADWGFPHGGPRAFGWRSGPDGRTPQSYTRAWNSDRGQARSNAMPAYRYEGPGRGYDYGNGYGAVRPAFQPEQAYNRGAQSYAARPYAARPETYPARPQGYAGGQAYAHSGYGYGNQGRMAQGYATRPGMAYGNSYSTYREPSYREPAYGTPQSSAPRGFGVRSYDAYGGESVARNEHSGGFHLFGHGHESDGFYRGHTPKNSFGGGYAPKGFGHEKAPKASHFGGGHGHGHFR